MKQFRSPQNLATAISSLEAKFWTRGVTHSIRCDTWNVGNGNVVFKNFF